MLAICSVRYCAFVWSVGAGIEDGCAGGGASAAPMMRRWLWPPSQVGEIRNTPSSRSSLVDTLG
jgi:hypothetical protein